MGGNSESREREGYELCSRKVLECKLERNEGETFNKLKHEDLIITGAFDGEICFYNYHTGKMMKRFVNLQREEVSNRYNLDYTWCAQNILQIETVGDHLSGHSIIVSTRDGVLREYGIDIENENLYLKKVYVGHHIQNGATDASVYGFEVDERRQIVASGGGDRTVRIWKLPQDRWNSDRAQSLNVFIRGNKDEVGGLKILGKRYNSVVSGDLSGNLCRFDMGKCDAVTPLASKHSDFVFTLDYSERMNVLFTSSGDKTSKFFDMRTDKEIECLKEGHEQGFQSVIYLEDKNELILGEGVMSGLPSRRADMLVYDLRKTKPSYLYKWDAHNCDIHRIHRIRETPGDTATRLLTCSRDFTVGLWVREDGGTEFKLDKRITRPDQNPDWFNIIPGISFLNSYSKYWKLDEAGFIDEFKDILVRCEYMRGSVEDLGTRFISVVVDKKVMKVQLIFLLE